MSSTSSTANSSNTIPAQNSNIIPSDNSTVSEKSSKSRSSTSSNACYSLDELPPLRFSNEPQVYLFFKLLFYFSILFGSNS
jgi:hypothetical protein